MLDWNPGSMDRITSLVKNIIDNLPWISQETSYSNDSTAKISFRHITHTSTPTRCLEVFICNSLLAHLPEKKNVKHPQVFVGDWSNTTISTFEKRDTKALHQTKGPEIQRITAVKQKPTSQVHGTNLGPCFRCFRERFLLANSFDDHTICMFWYFKNVLCVLTKEGTWKKGSTSRSFFIAVVICEAFPLHACSNFKLSSMRLKIKASKLLIPAL